MREFKYKPIGLHGLKETVVGPAAGPEYANPTLPLGVVFSMRNIWGITRGLNELLPEEL